MCYHTLCIKFKHILLSLETKQINNTFKIFIQNFTDLLRDFLTSYKNQKCVNKMKFLVRKWAEEFKNDPNLALVTTINNINT